VPIRSPHGRASAYRTLWAWPLRSPVRLVVTGAAVLAVVAGVSFGIGSLNAGNGGEQLGASPSTRSAPRSSTWNDERWNAESAAPAPTALPSVPELTPSPLPLSRAPAEAIAVAARWSAAWVRPPDGTTAEEWLDGLRNSTTDEYLGVLSGVDPANIPATRVTGKPRPVRVAASSVQAEVPTNALTLLVLVVDTDEGWRVAGYDRI
jgi:hypothetical protein